MPIKPMLRYKYYMDISVNSRLVEHKLQGGVSLDTEWFRRLISIYISIFHSICKQSNTRGLPIDLCKITYDGIDGPVQGKLRIFAKKKGALEDIFHIISQNKLIHGTAHLSYVKEVPEEEIYGYSALIRVRLPTKKQDALKAKQILENLGHTLDYINVMPSSSKGSTKRLVRYYFYRVAAIYEVAQKVDSYGFSLKNRLALLPQFGNKPVVDESNGLVLSVSGKVIQENIN